MPAFDNSAMDGYAVRADDTAGGPVVLREVGPTLAGQAAAAAVGAGEAVRIMTGAPMPAGADAVVPVERTEPGPTTARCRSTRPSRRATTCAAPATTSGPATSSSPPACRSRPATSGCSPPSASPRSTVVRRPRVGVLSTGDELVDGPGPLLAGQIRDSNRPALLALVEAAGAEAVDLGLAPDDAEAITEAVLERRHDAATPCCPAAACRWATSTS